MLVVSIVLWKTGKKISLFVCEYLLQVGTMAQIAMIMLELSVAGMADSINGKKNVIDIVNFAGK